MFSELTTPLVIALFLSYVALAMLITTAAVVRRTSIGRVQVLLWAVVGVGATSVAIRTTYYALT